MSDQNATHNFLVIGSGYVSDYFKKMPNEFLVVPKQPIQELIPLIKKCKTVVNAYEITEGSTQDLLKENYLFVQELYLACFENGKKLIHLSTANLYNDFDWDKNVETNKNLNLSSDYLISKRIAERVLESTDSIILRIKNPFDGTNHCDNWLVKALNRKKVSNWIDTHTYLPDLKKACVELPSKVESGLYNFVQTKSGSDLFYFHSVLKLPKYKNYNVSWKKNKRLDSNDDPLYIHADVNNTQIQQHLELTDAVAAVILSWSMLQGELDQSLYS